MAPNEMLGFEYSEDVAAFRKLREMPGSDLSSRACEPRGHFRTLEVAAGVIDHPVLALHLLQDRFVLGWPLG